MKPLCLVVQAFGPYADVQVFDFRDLGNHTFFLIHGDTGSGKSTILDAICYALYGDSSGGERTGLQLRSHHAPPARRTTVQFDFAVGCHRYRVTRSPEYERPKHRGIGTVTDQQIARLWLRNGCEDDDEPGEILAERWEQVSRRVIELLGFECNQFRQVVVLPQGQFRDFLIAPSGEREAILSFLFKTHEFRAIERALKDAANRIKRDHDHQSQRLTDLYQRAAVKDLAALQQERAQRVIELDAIKGQLGVLRTVADDDQRHLQEGQETQRKLNERALAEQNTAELDAQQAEVDAQRIELNQGQRAAALADIEAAAVQRHAEALQADQDRDHARQRYDNAIAGRDQVREALTQAEQREPEIEQSRQQLAQLQDIAQRAHALEEARAKLASAEQQIQVLAKQRLDVVDELGVASATLQSHDQSTAQCREVAAQGEARQLRFEQVQRLHEQRERLDVALAALAAAEQDAHNAAELHDNAVAAYTESQQHLEQSEQAWYAGQAGVLAQQLFPGSPCPVCGSHEHPLLAVAAADVPTEITLKRQRDAVRKQEKVRQDAFKMFTEKQRLLAETRAEHMALVTTLGNQHDVALDILREALRKAIDDLETARAAQIALPEQEQAQHDARDTVAKLKEQLALLEVTYGAAATEAEMARAILVERERGVPEHLRTHAAIEEAVTAAENLLSQLNAAIEQARKQTTEAEVEVAGTESAWRARMEASDQARQRAHEQQLALVERLVAQGFADRETYNAAKRPTGALSALNLRITTYERDCAIASDRLTEAVKAVEGLVAPDIEALTATAKQSRQRYDDTLQRQASLSEQFTQYVTWCDDAEQLSAILEQLQHQYLVMGEIANVANGENAHRMSFQRFVLAALLDEVLMNASHRLQAMSRGRYTLQRALDQQDRRSAGGLELEVLDLFTGRARLAKTLSGGESFLASLALALGLADVVQARTGGIHLETMFVDEGFGSLDERTLDQAIQTLSDLQQGGRLIGIISHVTELQRRVTARLEITSSPSGSTAKFVIGSAHSMN